MRDRGEAFKDKMTFFSSSADKQGELGGLEMGVSELMVCTDVSGTGNATKQPDPSKGTSYTME